MPAAAVTADPWSDTDVIDALAPRVNQLFVGVLSLFAVLTGWWVLWALLATQLAIGLVFGRKYCLPCFFYFTVVQPRRGEGRVEDSRPPRFANIIGFGCLTLASVLWVAGFHDAGRAVGGLVTALTLLAAATGLCVGCELYKLLARVRGISPGATQHLDSADFGVEFDEQSVVLFSHPLCSDCHELEAQLTGEGRTPVVVNVRESPDLARRYRVSVVPTAYAVDASGAVAARLA